MHLSASLTKALCVAATVTALAACGSSGPRRPTSAQDKSASNTTLIERCSEYDARGIPPPPECPQSARRVQRERTLPDLQDPLGTPGLPSGNLPGSPLPIR